MSKRPPQRSTVQTQQLRAKLNSIMQLIQKGNLAQANASLQPILRKHPALPEVNHVAAGLSASMNEHDRAIYYAQRASELAPDTPEYLTGLGSVLLRAGKYDEAIDTINRALQINPNLPDALVPLATAQMESGCIQDARSTFARVIAENPAHLAAANNLALLESDLAHADRAIDIIEAALTHHPEHPMLLDALCMFACYSDTKSPEQVAQIHRRFGQSVQSRIRPRTDHPNTPTPNDAYASASFRQTSAPTPSPTSSNRSSNTSTQTASKPSSTTPHAPPTPCPNRCNQRAPHGANAQRE